MLLAIGALLLATTAHAKKDPVIITNVTGTVGAASTTLYIEGENFSDGVFEPVVTLGTDSLTVLAGMWSDVEIVAELPYPAPPGDYLLTVTNHEDQVVAYDLTIGAVGPEGPQGPQGEPGTSIPDGTSSGQVLTWNGDNWIAQAPGAYETSRNNMQPFTAINYIIALVGVYPSRDGIDPFVGEIAMFGGDFAPRGWAMCNGQLLSISTNTALFSLLGTTYGGDGRTTFALPDLRGRAPIHFGDGPGLTPRSLGEKGGAETTQDQY